MHKIILPVAAALLLTLTNCQSNTKTTETNTVMIDSTGDVQSDADTATNVDATVYKMPQSKAFSGNVAGKKAKLYILKNKYMQVALSNYGARIVSIMVPDKNGKLIDVAPGFDDLKKYQQPGGAFMGPVVGRFGNRIAKGKFTLDGKNYQTELNNNGNNLHSGSTGFHSHAWDVKEADDKHLTLQYVSPDGEGGFPGTVTTNVTFTLTDDNGLKLDYTATTDKATPYNPTSHGFFNLNGQGTVNNHLMMIDADKFSAVDKGLIPQGEPVLVTGTPFDFRTPTIIGARINEKNEQLGFAGGYDHNFVLNKQRRAVRSNQDGFTKAVEVIGDETGIKMEVFTTEPAMQFYGGNFFKGSDTGRTGKPIGYREAFALETQHYPDSPNHPTYPNTILRPGATYKQTTEYKFSAVK